MTGHETKVGVYVDAENINRNGGYGMRYDILREFACRDGAQSVRLNTYVAFDREKAEQNPRYAFKTREFYSVIRDMGFKVIEKIVVWHTDETTGKRYGKANADLDMAVDALLQSEKLDRVLLGTGDGDFVQVVRALQNKGCRVEVLAFENVSRALRQEADLFFSGYLIPNLLPVRSDSLEDPDLLNWGIVGSRVRGTCYNYKYDKGYGFLRYMREIGSNVWIKDSRHEDSPFDSAFVHESEFPGEFECHDLPNRNIILEFDLAEHDKGVQAKNISAVYRYY